jgi:hypothetical protein
VRIPSWRVATWEPFSDMVVNVLEMVAKFMKSHGDTKMVCKMLSL